MSLWIVLFSFLVSPPHVSASMQPPVVPAMMNSPAAALSHDSPMRYRGIEQLLAKFEAEAESELDRP